MKISNVLHFQKGVEDLEAYFSVKIAVSCTVREAISFFFTKIINQIDHRIRTKLQLAGTSCVKLSIKKYVIPGGIGRHQCKSLSALKLTQLSS